MLSISRKIGSLEVRVVKPFFSKKMIKALVIYAACFKLKFLAALCSKKISIRVSMKH